MGKFHPHGDAPIYDALVRMAQPFSMRYPLVDGQGNFGSVDGDPPAAMRYTEARLSRIAAALLEDIDKETVDFRPNYDDSEDEPEVLPTRVPNLLVNGSSGIAVGMATNIPPHNLTRDHRTPRIALIQNPDTPLAEAARDGAGPGLPHRRLHSRPPGHRRLLTRSGRGSLKIRAKAATEKMGKDREAIIVTEIPFQVNKSRLIEQIAALVNEKKHRRHLRYPRRERPRRHAHRVRAEARRAGRSHPQQPLQAHAAADQLRRHHAVHRQRPAARAGPDRCIKHFIDHRVEVVRRRTDYDCARRATASTSCSASRRRSTISTK